MRLAAVLFAALVLLTPCAALAQDVVAGETGRQLDETLRRATYGQFWGSILVARDGEILLAKGYGLANQELAPITADSFLELASVSKQFTAAAILRLEAQGKLSTFDTIDKHLADVPEDKKAITIHHLLTHTSGLASPRVAFESDDRDEVVAALLSGKLRAPPGTTFEYSNPGYWLLAAIIERASGRRYEDVVRDDVLRPAGMTASACQTDPALDLARCVDRVDEGNKVGDAGTCPYAFTWGYRGSGGVVTSAHEMFAWDRALRSDTFLAPDARSRMFTANLSTYGYGWEITPSPVGRVARHTGGVAGFAVSWTHWLERDACVLVMTGENHNPVRLGDLLARTLFPEIAQTVRAVIRVDVHGASEHGMSVLPGSADFAVAKQIAGVSVTFQAPGDAAAPLEIHLSSAAAARVASELDAHATPILRESPQTPNPPVRVEMYTAAYKGRQGPLTIEGPDVGLLVQPGTPHPEPGGELRVTLIVTDPARSFWPVFVKLSADKASELAKALR